MRNGSKEEKVECMKNLLRLTALQASDVYEIFRIADEIREGKYDGFLGGKSVVLFFPAASIRTRVIFEKGIRMLGGQPILFPSDALDKREETKDVFGYLNNWADLLVICHKEIRLLEEATKYVDVPVINAMTDVNHPCEILSDLYALSKRRKDFIHDKYLFCGKNGGQRKGYYMYGFPARPFTAGRRFLPTRLSRVILSGMDLRKACLWFNRL